MTQDSHSKITDALAVGAVFTASLRIAPAGAGWLDTGELMTAAWHLGIPHNPGYPVYCLGAKLAAFLPLGNIAWKINAGSMVLAALCLWLLGRWSKALWGDGKLGWIVLLTVGMSPLFLEVAVVGEVYSLMALVFAGTGWLLASSFQWGGKRWSLLLGFLLGLELAVHYSTVTWWPAWVMMAGAPLPIILRRPRKSLAIVSFLLASSLFLYLPLRSATHPPINWNAPAQASGFLRHVFASEHRHASLPSLSLQKRWQRTQELARHLGRQLPWAFWPLAVLGIVAAPGLGRKGMALLLLILGDTAYTLFLNVVPFKATPFGLPTLFCLGLLAVGGLELLRRRLPSPGWVWQLTGALLAVALVLHGRGTWEERLPERDSFPRHLAQAMTGPLPKNSVLVAYTDTLLFTCLYQTRVERYRDDVTLLPRYFEALAHFTYPGLPQDLLPHPDASGQAGGTAFWDHPGMDKLLAFLLQSRCGYWEIDPDRDEPRYDWLEPAGWIFAIRSPGFCRVGTGPYYRRLLDLHKERPGSYGREVMALYWNTLGLYEAASNHVAQAQDSYSKALHWEPAFAAALTNLGNLKMKMANKPAAKGFYLQALKGDPGYTPAALNLGLMNYEERHLLEAERYFRLAAEGEPPQAQAAYNLGVLLAELGEQERAEEAYQRALEIHPDYEPARKALGMGL